MKVSCNLVNRTQLSEEEIAARIQSVNLHITKACNYKCRFCYAHFNQVKNHLSLDEWKQIISLLAEAGTKKVTFVGGEPTLVPYLPELVIHAKELGMTTMVVTNGSKIDRKYISRFEGKLDWIGLSIDSSREEVSKELGRGRGDHVRRTVEVARLVRNCGIRLKVNTVVTKLTWDEDMGDLISELNPARWKVFQMLPIKGENDAAIDLTITDHEFQHFLKRHAHLDPIGETNDDMIESYVMVDPSGCFYTNSDNRLHHVASILEYGVHEAFERVNFRLEKFVNRGGKYDWEVSS